MWAVDEPVRAGGILACWVYCQDGQTFPSHSSQSEYFLWRDVLATAASDRQPRFQEEQESPVKRDPISPFFNSKCQHVLG